MDASLIRRVIRRIRGKVGVEDYDNVVCDALKRMARNQSRNRERVVRLIAIRNHYRELYGNAAAQSRQLERQLAEPMRKRKPRRPVTDLATEKYLLDLTASRHNAKALECELMLDSVKRMIRQEEADFRFANNRALAAKTLIKAEAWLETVRRIRVESERS